MILGDMLVFESVNEDGTFDEFHRNSSYEQFLRDRVIQDMLHDTKVNLNNQCAQELDMISIITQYEGSLIFSDKGVRGWNL